MVETTKQKQSSEEDGLVPAASSCVDAAIAVVILLRGERYGHVLILKIAP